MAAQPLTAKGYFAVLSAQAYYEINGYKKRLASLFRGLVNRWWI